MVAVEPVAGLTTTTWSGRPTQAIAAGMARIGQQLLQGLDHSTLRADADMQCGDVIDLRRSGSPGPVGPRRGQGSVEWCWARRALFAHPTPPELAMRFDRITVDAAQMGGTPCLRGLRIPVATVVGMVADGMSTEEILRAYPDLEAEDIREALRYAAEALRERGLPLIAGS